MITTDQFCKKTYGEKFYKLCFDASFGCPNRKNKRGEGGCIFCSEGGSGDFAIKIDPQSPSDLDESIEKAKEKVRKKFKGDHFIAYFQAYSNTYAPADELRKIYLPIVTREDISVLSIATRPDCLNDEVYEVLKELNDIKPLWVELGLQTTKEESVKYIRRGYETRLYDEAVKRLNELNIHVITHVILYLPGENKEDMFNTIRHVIKAESKGIKLQLLHVLKGTDLAKDIDNIHIPTLEEYAKTLSECVKLLPEDMVVHRLTGDAPKKLLIAPLWSADKKKVLNTINAYLYPDRKYYVYMLLCEDGSLYTGSTDDVKKRFMAHKSGKGAKYTRSRKPIKIVYTEELPTKNEALSREWHIKQLSRAEKEKLIAGQKKEI